MSKEDMCLRVFAAAVLHDLSAQLSDPSSDLNADLAPCGYDKIQSLYSITNDQNSSLPSHNYTQVLSRITTTAYESMQVNKGKSSLAWRRLYTEASLIWSLRDCFIATDPSEEFWEQAIARLDRSIIIAGAPERLYLIFDVIEKIQHTYLPALSSQECLQSLECAIPSPTLHHNSSHPIPSLEKIPSISSFQSKNCQTPFVLRGFANDWPAVSERKWASKKYLQSVAGRGRIVPVEIGNDYRTNDWTQRMMDWDEFTNYVFPCTGQSVSSEQIYLAQYNLFRQFPALDSDISIPDYVYCALPPPEHFPQYQPPSNEEQLVLNVWLGPNATISPAHTDPFYNFYVQVVGRKSVWLAPPTVSRSMSSYAEASYSGTNSSDEPGMSNGVLSNTSRIDVFSDYRTTNRNMSSDYALFQETVVPEAMSTILEPGDVLFFPPGWWHAMRSETVSFSVSMWF